MNITDMRSSLPYLFEAELTAFLWGRAGIGKTSIVKQYAKSKGYHFFPLYLGTQSDLGDVLGLAEFVDNGDGSKSTAFATPKWLKDAITYCNENPESGAIIFLDEFNRARKDIRNGMFSLALDKTFHTIKLPKNCHLIAAGNPPVDEYSVEDISDTALMSRFVHIKLEPTVEEFMQYAKSNKFDHTLISFIAEQPQLLEDAGSSFDLPVKVDRRSYDRLNQLFQVNTPPALLDQLMYGIIGVERVVAYKLHLKNVDKPLTGDEIINGTGVDRLTSWSNPENISASMLGNCCDNLVELLKQRDEAKQNLTEKHEENLMKFFEIIPRDILYAALKKAIKADIGVFKAFFKNSKYEPKLIAMTKEVTGKAA